MSADSAPVAIFKKKSRPANARKREASPPSSSAINASTSSSNDASASSGPSSGSAVVLPTTRRTTANPLVQGSRKRKLGTRDETTYSDEEDTALADARGPSVKWKATGDTAEAARAELEIMAGEDAEQVLKKARKEQEDEERLDDGMYHGSSAYKSHVRKEREIPKAMRIGPQRSNNTIRTVTMIDYQPDVCKDYKETGFCGFGDTCKFLHDRGTYLQGWQLDKLAANPQGDDSSDSDSDEEDIPWACYICRKPYTDPIVTKCGHYFCSACAIKRFAKTPKCAACGAPTAGIFNRADKVIEKMRAKKAEKEERDAAPGSDDDGERGGGGVEVEIGGGDSD